MAKIPKIDWKCSNWFQIFHNVWKYENNVYPKYNLSGRNKPKMVQNISKLTPKLNFWKRWKFSKSLKIDLKFIHMAKITLNCSKWRQNANFENTEFLKMSKGLIPGNVPGGTRFTFSPGKKSSPPPKSSGKILRGKCHF